MKNAGADGAWYAMDLSTNLALAQGLIQNGVKMKAQLMATGYGHELLEQPVAKTLGPDIIFTTGWAPVELKTKATKRFQADLEKYADFTERARLRDLHRLHRLRPRDPRAEEAGQGPRPDDVLANRCARSARTTPAVDSAAPTRA